MHLLSLVADRLWLVKDGRVTPYDDDLDTYRSQLLSGDKPTPRAPSDKPKVKKASRDEILALRAEVRKCEDRLDNEGDIIHVGIIMENHHIIHAHGKVRIDRIDHSGIYNVDTNTHSHKLRVIKSIV